MIWSDVFRCRSCKSKIIFWDAAYNAKDKTISEKLKCGNCRKESRKSELKLTGEAPVSTHYYCPKCRRHLHHEVTEGERRRISEIKSRDIPYWYPNDRLDMESEMYKRNALDHRGIFTVADFFTKRNLWALSRIWKEIEATRDWHLKRKLQFVFTATLNRASIRYVWSPKRPLNVHVSNLYVPSLRCEFNVWKVFGRKFEAILKAAELTSFFQPSDIRIGTGSATELDWIPNDSVDYVFTDPPFGGNIFYADIGFVWESWLRNFTCTDKEAVVNKAKRNGKTAQDYERIMSDSLAEMARILKPGRWATVIFHNSDSKVWAGIQRGFAKAGFDVRGAAILDKGQYSPKQLKSGKEFVLTEDIIFNLQKPLLPHESRPLGKPEHLEGVIRRIIAENGGRETPLPRLYTKLVQHFLVSGWDISDISLEMLAQIAKGSR